MVDEVSIARKKHPHLSALVSFFGLAAAVVAINSTLQYFDFLHRLNIPDESKPLIVQKYQGMRKDRETISTEISQLSRQGPYFTRTFSTNVEALIRSAYSEERKKIHTLMNASYKLEDEIREIQNTPEMRAYFADQIKEQAKKERTGTTAAGAGLIAIALYPLRRHLDKK